MSKEPFKKHKAFNWSDRIKSFSHAWRGLQFAFSHEHNLRIHLTVAVFVLVLSLYLNISPLEWMIVVGCIVAVIASEIFNSALEHLADALHPEHDERVGRAKDIAAGAVLVIAIGAAIVGALVFLPYLLT